MKLRNLTPIAAILTWLGVGHSHGSPAVGKAEEQAVIVKFDYGNKDWSIFFRFQSTLDAAISKSGTGEYDRNELAADGSDGFLYFYGPDADKLLIAVKEQLEAATFMKNVRATLRYGSVEDPKARTVQIRLRE